MTWLMVVFLSNSYFVHNDKQITYAYSMSIVTEHFNSSTACLAGVDAVRKTAEQAKEQITVKSSSCTEITDKR